MDMIIIETLVFKSTFVVIGGVLALISEKIITNLISKQNSLSS